MPSMDYAEAREAFFKPRPPTPRRPGRMSGTCRVERCDMQSNRCHDSLLERAGV